MGCHLGKPKDGMTGEKVTLWEAGGVWHQKGVDGKTYIIISLNLCGCNTFQELSEALKPDQRMGYIT